MKLLNQLAREADYEARYTSVSLEEELFHFGEAQRNQIYGALACEELDQIDDMQSALEDLAHVAESIKAATPREAAMFHVATEAIFAASDIDTSNVAALEDGEEGAQPSSKLREYAARIFAALKQIFAKVMAFIKDFFQHVGKTIGNAKARLDEAKAKLAKLHDPKPQSSTIKAVPLQAGEHWCHNEQDIAKSLIEYNGQLSTFAKDSSSYLKGVSDALYSLFHELTGQSFLKMFNQGETKRLLNVVHAAAGIRASAKNPVHGQEETVLVHGDTQMRFFDAQGEPMLGGKIVRFTYVHGFETDDATTTYEALKAVLTRCRYSVGHVETAHQHLEHMSAGTRGGLEKILEVLGRTIEHVTERNSEQVDSLAGAAAFVRKEVERTGRVLASSSQNYRGNNAQGQAMLQCCWAAGRFYATEAAKPLAELMMNTLRQVNLALVYVNKSIDNFGSPVDAKAREAAGAAPAYKNEHHPKSAPAEKAHVDAVLDADPEEVGKNKEWAQRVD